MRRNVHGEAETHDQAWNGVNQFMGVASEEDKGFKRHSDMVAARPLTAYFNGEDE